MAYITQAQLDTSYVPKNVLDRAFDLAQNPDNFVVLAEAASRRVDAALAPTIDTSALREPYPPIVIQAALIFAADMVYRRAALQSPWEDAARAIEERLNKIGDGELDPGTLLDPDAGSGNSFTEYVLYRDTSDPTGSED